MNQIEKILLCSLWTIIASAANPSQQGRQTTLNPESTDTVPYKISTNPIDVIIINDIQDLVTPNNSWSEIEQRSAMILNLVESLMSNSPIVITRKCSWISIQNIVNIWNNYLTQPATALAKQNNANAQTISQAQIYKEIITNLNKKYETVIKELQKPTTIEEKRNIAKNFLDQYQQDTMQNLSINHINTCYFVYISYKILCTYNFICKEINDDFIVFIPRRQIQNQLGLKYESLNDYAYQNFNTETDQNAIWLKAFTDGLNKKSGKILLQSLKEFFIQKNEAAHGTILPFFNFLITGHGTPDTMIAEISIKNMPRQKKSDFIKILDFFNHQVLTKTLTLISCYNGGKKIIDTFNIENQFNNSYLDSITYPIIFNGSFLTPTSSTIAPYSRLFFHEYSYQNPFLFSSLFLKQHNYLFSPRGFDIEFNSFKSYFTNLNQNPPNYNNAAKILTLISNDNAALPENLHVLRNYVSIKYPHSSWLTPTEIFSRTTNNPVNQKTIKNSKKISQIEALSTPVFTIQPLVSIILLQANIIQTILLPNRESSSKIPYFLPLNIHNQNYIITKVETRQTPISNAQDLHNLMKHLLGVKEIEEPVNVVIKELMVQNQTYKNVCIFSLQNSTSLKLNSYPQEAKISGYFYTNPNNVTQIVSWRNEKDDYTYPKNPPIPQNMDIHVSSQIIHEIERQAQEGLKSFKNLEINQREKTKTKPNWSPLDVGQFTTWINHDVFHALNIDKKLQKINAPQRVLESNQAFQFQAKQKEILEKLASDKNQNISLDDLLGKTLYGFVLTAQDKLRIIKLLSQLPVAQLIKNLTALMNDLRNNIPYTQGIPPKEKQQILNNVDWLLKEIVSIQTKQLQVSNMLEILHVAKQESNKNTNYRISEMLDILKVAQQNRPKQ